MSAEYKDSRARGKKIIVAFSGGVDSAAAAIILKEQGMEVTALTMLLPFPDQSPAFAETTARLASAIGIEHEVIDFRSEFERLVVAPFVESYACGLTPNPCVICNREVKFGLLLQEAKSRGCDLLATGHYARIADGEDGILKILRGSDKTKDQSYVLWTLSQETLDHMILPLGSLSKDEAVELIRKTGVSDLVHSESQDICFLSGKKYRGLIEKKAPGVARPGPVVDLHGNILGEHPGLPFYTVGQRHGLGLASHQALYVLEIIPETNTVVVGGKKHRSSQGFKVTNVNFIAGNASEDTISCEVVTRYRGDFMPADVFNTGGENWLVHYRHPGAPAAPGQSAVFYRGEELLGGGFIARS